MKKIIYLLFALLLVGSLACKRKSYVFLEEKAPEGSNFQYYSTVVEKWEELFTLDENFRKKHIGLKDRENFTSYAKINFDETGTPTIIENYKQDSFNTHMYYPYLIYIIERNDQGYQVKQTIKEWEKQELVEKNIAFRFFEKEKDGFYPDLIKTYNESGDLKPYENRFFNFKMIAEDSETNRRVIEAIAADKNFIIIEGFEEAHFNVRIRMFFYDALRTDAGFFALGNATPIRARFMRGTPEGFDFSFFKVLQEEEISDVDANFYKTEK